MKRSELRKTIEETITEILGEDLYAEKPGADPSNKLPNVTSADKATANDPKFKAKYDKVNEVDNDDDDSSSDDKEPSKAELRKNAGVAKIKDALAKVTKEMKELATKFKEAEGDKKKKSKTILKS